jgi:kinetochore protein NDC80
MSKAADPRGITEKSYQQYAIKEIITYLTTHNYPQMISPKVMHSPDTRTYLSIAGFLLRQYDANMSFDCAPRAKGAGGSSSATRRYEDELPLIFQTIGYMFKLRPSQLQSVGAPQSWPHLLAALHWMVELLNYCETAFQESDGGAGAFDDDDTNKIFIDFLSQGYKLFLEGDDDDAERVVALHEQIQFVFDEKAGTLEKASAEIQEGNAKMQRQLGADTDGGRPLEREQKRKAVLDEDERKFNELLTKLVNYVTELRKKAAAAAGTLAELTTEVAALDEENASLKHVISLQEMTPADVERMGKEKAELTATLAGLREQKEAKQKEVWEGKDALGQAAQRLETKTQKANAAAARLDLLDADGALSGAIDHELRLHAAGGASGGATVEIGGGVLPALQSLKLDLADEHKRKHDDYLAAEDGAAAAETSRMGREKLLAQQKAELAQLDADGARKKEEREGALAEKRAERAALGVSAEDKKARAKSELDQVRAEKAAKQEEYDAFVARVQRDEQVQYDELGDRVAFLIEHKEQLSTQLRELEQHCENQQQRINDMIQPR